jgi:hypothetical protein
MADSSDYMTCKICGGYEICLITTPGGHTSGLYDCHESGHVFCKNCFPEFDKNIRTVENVRRIIKEDSGCSAIYHDEVGRDIETDSDEKVMEYSDEILHEFYAEQGVPTKECPVCQGDFISDEDVLGYLLEQVGVSIEEIKEDIKKKRKNDD